VNLQYAFLFAILPLFLYFYDHINSNTAKRHITADSLVLIIQNYSKKQTSFVTSETSHQVNMIFEDHNGLPR